MTAATADTAVRRGGRKARRFPLDDWRFAWLFLLPTLALVLVYKYGPIAQAIQTATHQYTVAGIDLGSVGLGNFVAVLSDPSFLKSLGLTLVFVVIKVPLTLAIGFALAFLLLKSSRINSLVRSGVLIPAITPIVVIGLIFLFVFDKEIGMANAVGTFFGLDRVGWLTEPTPARFVIVFVSLWRDAGFVMLVYLGALGSIPESILEAARVDRAKGWRMLTEMIIPLVQRSTQFATTYATIAAFQFFAPIFVMTKGGPQGATDVAPFHIYETAFVFFDWGNANAMSLILVICIMIFTGIEMLALRTRWEY